ncbi:MAG: hypothetical protein IT435_01345 [Phycisphaerales bacterium]|nr:hypothetical protein [Phycisphaerales bacterium]
MPRFSVIATAWAIGAASMGIAAPPEPVGGERAVMDRFEPGAVMIRFEEGASQGQRQSAIAAVGGKIRREFPAVPGLASLEIAVPVVEGIDLLERMPGVLYAEPNFYVQPVIVPNDPAFSGCEGCTTRGRR